MSERARQYLGVQYQLAFTGRNRWGEGKTHLQHYDRSNRDWVFECRTSGFHPYHSTTVEPDRLPEPCKRCLPMIERVFGELWGEE